MIVQHFYDLETFTLSYVIFDELTKDAIIIDSVLNFDPPSGKVEDTSAQTLVSFIKKHHLVIHYILETHAHADHLSASQILKQSFPAAKIAISSHISIVQDTFRAIFNIGHFKDVYGGFDTLLHDNEAFQAGSILITPFATPGHTPACMSFLIGNNLFTGDVLFMPDYGTGRCDFPKGSASDLYESVKKLYQLPDETHVFVGHDYRPNGRELMFQTTIGESKKNNIQLKLTTLKEEFINFRSTRDKTLAPPRLLFPSIQVNIAAGKLPDKEENGVSYLKLPLRPHLTLGKL